VLCMALIELQGRFNLLLIASGAVLIVGRFLHQFALDAEPQRFRLRMVAMGCTLSTLAVLACALLYLSVWH
jgi:uncharacterized membrane protein YecN with MAPEG domain